MIRSNEPSRRAPRTHHDGLERALPASRSALFARGSRGRLSSSLLLGALFATASGACGQGPTHAGDATATSAEATTATSPIRVHPVNGSDVSPFLTPTPTSETSFRDHGGPVLAGTTNVYFIWYGNWQGNSAIPILSDFAKSIGGSPFWAINTQYSDPGGNHPSAIAFKGGAFDPYSMGSSLTNGDVAAVVSNAITSNKVPSDPNAVYFVLTSSDVSVAGFCTTMCGYHGQQSVGGVDIKYAFVGDASSACPGACAPFQNRTKSPNGNVGADAMASILSHELEETVTDPDGTGWFDDVTQDENGDACAWTFGDTYPAGGATANVRLGARDFLLQRNLIPIGTPSCALELHYTHPSASTGASVRGDFDGDGIGDVLWRDTASGGVSVWLMKPDGTPRAMVPTTGDAPPPLEWQILGAADFNGDGKSDVLWRNVRTGDVDTWTMNGGAASSKNLVAAGVGPEWQVAGTGDFDVDGKDDILWHDVVHGDTSVWTMNGTTATSHLLASGVGLDWQPVGVGDFDGNGTADILWRATSNGAVSVWLMKAFVPKSVLTASSLAATVDIGGVGDVDGDGRSDVLLRDTSSGDVTAWLMNGGAIASTKVMQKGTGLEWRLYGAADMSGDHVADLLWRNAKTGDVSVWLVKNAAPAKFVLSATGIGMDWQIMAE